MKKKLSILLVIALLLGTLLPMSAQAAGNQIMRIGLAFKDKYSDNTVASADLRSKVDAGFSLGYYDDRRQFVSLGWTDQTRISVLITQNLYLTADGGYSYSDGGRGCVGCYHVQLPGTYPDFASAQAVADTVENGFVAWIGGTYYVRVGSYNRRAAAEEAAASCGVEGAVMGETGGYGYSVVPTGSTRILFQFDADTEGESGALGVQPIAGEGEKAVTVYNEGRSYYGGFRFERISGGASTVVNVLGMEDYIKGVIPYEMSPSWPLEALKAQAVCARTYAGTTRHGSSHFDLCTTTCCQVYKGTSGAGPVSDQAVEETAGQMAYYNGKRIDAVYYSSNGGASEDAKNVWGIEHGYLKGKPDPYEADIADIAGNYRWSVSASELKAKLNKLGYPCADIVDITTKQSAVGNVIEITLLDTAGKSYTFSREKVRTTFGLNSIRFTVESGGTAVSGYQIAGASAPAAETSGLYALGGDGSVSPLPQDAYVLTDQGVKALEPTTSVSASGGTLRLNGTGWGHNVGMSQWGAYAMAKQGFGYQDILKFYYTGITVE